ncbi:MAG: protein translocase subunit SecD, partial [Gammaproteobacteria bacterium]|nr:protein translocase subunit SecD [Gammaproteobacteria bacterium]
MNRNPLWKTVLVAVVLLAALVIALPNVFGEDPALQISLDNGANIDKAGLDEVRRSIEAAGVEFSSAYDDDGRLMLRFANVESQLRSGDRVREALGKGYVVALTLAPRTPEWLAAMGLKPMSLGLDLRGGVHFLFQVDMDEALRQRIERYATDFSKLLRDNRIRRNVRVEGEVISIELQDVADLDR